MKKGTPPQKRTDNSPSEENNGYPTNRPQPPWLASLDEDAPKSYKRVSNGHLTSGCFANAILLIGAILIIGAIWGAIYGISKYHDSAWSWVSREYQVISGKVSDLKDTIADSAPSIFPTQTPNQSQSSVTPSKTPAPTVSITPTVSGVNSRTGQYKNYYLGLADTSEGNLSGNGCYDDTGKFIILINNKNATDPTYSQLVSFLRQNRTDRFPYTYTLNVAGFYYGSAESHVNLKRIQNIIDGTEQPMPPHVCADFAERLHNEAEMAGIRCAYVSIDLSGYSDPYNYGIPSNSGHALNVFQTTDRGLIYVDVTNSPGPSRSVTTVSLQVGKQYIPVSLFPEQGWDSTYSSMGTVTDVQVIWDGTWNN